MNRSSYSRSLVCLGKFPCSFVWQTDPECSHSDDSYFLVFMPLCNLPSCLCRQNFQFASQQLNLGFADGHYKSSEYVKCLKIPQVPESSRRLELEICLLGLLKATLKKVIPRYPTYRNLKDKCGFEYYSPLHSFFKLLSPWRSLYTCLLVVLSNVAHWLGCHGHWSLYPLVVVLKDTSVVVFCSTA